MEELSQKDIHAFDFLTAHGFGHLACQHAAVDFQLRLQAQLVLIELARTGHVERWDVRIQGGALQHRESPTSVQRPLSQR